MPTRAGIATVITAITCLVCGRIFGIFELYILAAAMLALVLCAIVWVVLNWRSLEVSRSVNPARLHVGAMSTVTLNLNNRRVLPTPVARISDEVEGTVRADAHVPPIRRHRTTRASYRVPTERRGRIDVGPMRTRVTDPFGLASTTRVSAPDTHLLVLPKVDVIPPPPQPGGSLNQRLDRSPNRVGNSGDEFSSLRGYVLGDDLRKVHWPSSARGDELVVRTENIPEQGHSLVLLDVRLAAADEDTFERMVSAAASICVGCNERGDRIRLVTTAGDDLTADSDREFETMLDFLALVGQSTSPSVSLPFRLGHSGADAGALVVARDAEPLLATLPTGTARGTGGYVVRFHPEGARPTTSTARLPSSRMIEIEPADDFADAWGRVVGRTASRT